MKLMTKKLIAIDLDGTLLRSDHTISDDSVSVIAKVIEQGHTVVIATGRPYLTAKTYYEQLGLATPMINFNGALTHLPGKTWAGEHAVTIDTAHVHELLKQTDRFELDFISTEYKNHFFLTLDHKEAIDPAIFGLTELPEELRLFPEKITTNPLSLLVQTRHADKYQLARDIKAHFKGELEVDSWGGPLNILEFSPKGVNKAYALEKLLAQLGFDRSDLIAFGDEHNDTEMLAFAQTGYAMKNANPLLLEFADEQIPWTCNEDGVSRKLSELFL